jgi:hypothetical protein
MVEARAKFIILVARLMEPHGEALADADDRLYRETGKHWDQLAPEDWYDIKLCNRFIEAYVEASGLGDRALVRVGREMYPTIKKTSGLPPWLKTTADYLRHETVVYMASVRGRGVAPRRIMRMEDGHAVIEAKIRAWDCRIQEGVYLGVLDLAGVKEGRVEQTKCVRRGGDICEFDIVWQPSEVTDDTGGTGDRSKEVGVG